MSEDSKKVVKTSEVLRNKIPVGTEVDTSTGHKARILALDAKVGRENDIIALILVNDEIDFIEWYRSEDYDEKAGILVTPASSYNLIIK